MTPYSLLREPLIHTEGPGGRSELSLPQVLHALGNSTELEFQALRPHQQHAWHAFLVQLAALALHRAGDRRLDRTAADWEAGLLNLSSQAGEDAWILVCEDLTRPAFLQPPVPEGTLASFKKRLRHPDTLDVLVTAKNHDEKQERLAAPRPEHWLYSLVTLQTMEGFLGRGNYGIARMNGGFASRPAVALAPGLDWGERFRRDVGVWLDARGRLTEDFGYPETGGRSLLWLDPWSGGRDESLPLTSLDPFFIEICRRVRLVETAKGGLEAWATNTEASRVASKEAQGATGDAWAPIDREGKGLTVGRGGFNYRLVSDLLLSGEYGWRPALRPRPEDGESPVLIAQVLVRGQGETQGYHERLLPIPPQVRTKLGVVEERQHLGALAQERVERTRKVARRVLHPALCVLLQGGRDEVDFRDRRTGPWLERFDGAVDVVFFGDLWAAADSAVDASQASRQWSQRLLDLARVQLDAAIAEAPIPQAVAPKAVARAEIVFRGAARKRLPEAFPSTSARLEEVS